MGRVLLYPTLFLAGLVFAAGIVLLIARAVASAHAVAQRRERDQALAGAQWEPYTDTADGTVVFGVQLVARWGNKTEILRRDSAAETLEETDALALIRANDRMVARAQTYNSLHIESRADRD